MTTTHRVIGTGVARSDGPEKVTGSGKYSLDVTVPGTLWAKILRSPYPHARIVRVDASRALALPGVQAVLTPDEVAGLRTGKRLQDEPVLAWERALFIGDKVAAVAADDEETAEEALSLIEVEYEELPAVATVDDARAPGAPVLHPDFNSYANVPAPQETPSNVFAHSQWSKGDVAQGFAEADVVVERTYTTPRTHQAYLEPHNTLVWIDPDGQVQVWLGTKSPFANRASLSALIDVPPDGITVNFAHVGGDFGGKGDITGAPICYFLAKKTGRPVKLVLDYSEELYAMNPRHESVMRVRAGAKTRRDADGVGVGGLFQLRGVRRIQARPRVEPRRDCGDRGAVRDPARPDRRVPGVHEHGAVRFPPFARGGAGHLRGRVAHGRAGKGAGARPGRVAPPQRDP